MDLGLSGTYPYTLTVLNCNGAYSDTLTDAVEAAWAPVVYRHIYLPVIYRGE